MSEDLKPGLHPDADSLSAFAEGLLPEHERLQCLAHLADCSRCREIVFLAQEPPPSVVVPTTGPAWRRWFAPVPAMAAAAAVCVAVLAVSLYMHHEEGESARNVVARVEKSQPDLAPGPITREEAQALPPVTPEAAPINQLPRAKLASPPAAKDAAAEKKSPAATESVDISPPTRGLIPPTSPARLAGNAAPASPSPLPPPPVVAQSGNSQ